MQQASLFTQRNTSDLYKSSKLLSYAQFKLPSRPLITISGKSDLHHALTDHKENVSEEFYFHLQLFTPE